jgi:hypothetical protein
MKKGQVISVLGREDAEEDGESRGAFQSVSEFLYGRSRVSAKTLQDRLREFLAAMDEIVQQLPAQLGEFDLDSMSFSVEVSTKGNVSLLGVGGEVGGKGGLTFALKRRQAK